MGKVFSWEEISSNRVPRLEDFSVIGTLLQQRLNAAEAIKGALLIGSFLRRDHNVRSDIDVVVLYLFEQRQKAMEIFRAIANEAVRRNVPLEIISLDVEYAETRHHHISPLFFEHFRQAALQGGVIKCPPVELITPNRDSFEDDIRNYLINKIRRLEKAEIFIHTLTVAERLRLIQKALELPVYVARKMLRLSGVEFPTGDSKQEVMRLYRSLRIPGADEPFELVKRLNADYSGELEYQLEYPNQERYEQSLRALTAAIPLAMAFARANMSHLFGPLPLTA